jgi:death-on-curing protein
MTFFPTLEQVLDDCAEMGLKVRDPGLLDSALHRPRSSFAGTEVYPTVPLKAAALLHSLVRNHPLVDGNKRLAWLGTVIFLDLNGWRSTLDNVAAAQLVLRMVVEHEMPLDQIEAALKPVRVSYDDQGLRTGLN